MRVCMKVQQYNGNVHTGSGLKDIMLLGDKIGKIIFTKSKSVIGSTLQNSTMVGKCQLSI